MPGRRREVPPEDEEIEFREPSIVAGRPAPTLEEYIAQHVSAVMREMANGLKEAEHKDENRVARAERYARWRHAGYLAGEITSL